METSIHGQQTVEAAKLRNHGEKKTRKTQSNSTEKISGEKQMLMLLDVIVQQFFSHSGVKSYVFTPAAFRLFI